MSLIVPLSNPMFGLTPVARRAKEELPVIYNNARPHPVVRHKPQHNQEKQAEESQPGMFPSRIIKSAMKGSKHQAEEPKGTGLSVHGMQII
jgi:hypothetical protein